MPYESEKIKSRVFYYLCMVLAGCILANVVLRCDRDLQAFILPFTDSSQLAGISVQKTVLYVFLQRVKQMVIVYLLYKVFPAKAVFSIGLSVLLFLFGFVISCQMFYLGISGVWFLLLCLFPHYLIYLGMLYYLAVEVRKTGEDKMRKRMAVLVLIMTFFVGILSESILSKIFLKNFLQYIGM